VARDGSGVVVRGDSIQISFQFEGRQCRLTLRTSDGRVMAPTPANLKHATRLRADIVTKIRAGVFVWTDHFGPGNRAGGTTVADQLAVWLRVTPGAASTRELRGHVARFWEQHIGKLPLSGVKRSDILAALAKRPLWSGASINNHTSGLRQAFALAVADGALAENPCRGIAKAKYQTPPPDPFTLEEAEQIVAAAPCRELVEFRLFTGLRTSEVCGLRWSSVDFRRREISVREAVVRGAEKAETKTGKARTVALNPRALAALQRQKARTFLHGTDSRVFADSHGGVTWISDKQFTDSVWRPLLKRLGLRYRPPNDARHTYATMLLMSGCKPAYAAGQMGHSKEVFFRTYARWIDGDHNTREADRLAAFIERKTA
jgi:integrase